MKCNTNYRIPDSFKDCDECIMSNFDSVIELDVVRKIKGEKYYAHYPGYNFCGYVWWEDDKWHCEVWRYGMYRQTFSSEYLDDLKECISAEYGYD